MNKLEILERGRIDTCNVEYERTQARRLRCTWYDYYEKSVTFRPFQVGTLNAVTANFLGDSLQCWMQIQVGKGPWASEVGGIVKIGQTMTMVLGIKGSSEKRERLNMLYVLEVIHDLTLHKICHNV